ncbi:hypothetical protein BG011_009938 [Mortierella polycephala]|uniref:SAM domain-containing protein n=1 Tax=Mortierella polycephala TaxID=41804 RepID=A0A9P6TW51_9FUNG|nr:hypothetical protein BG011_009938 [Mortierella polycephala]
MEPIITSFSSADSSNHDEYDQSSTLCYKKVNVPLAYPSEAFKEQSNMNKAYVYPPLMSPSDEFFHPASSALHSPTSAQPINIPQGQSRRNSLKVSSARAGSLPTLSHMPSPPASPWKRSNSCSRPSRSATMIVDETPYPDLPTDVRTWTSSHVAEYLGYSLRPYPRAITDDLGRYVRQSACLNGAQFIDLRQEDLERMQINPKWRTMIMKAVGMLRRETIRASRVDMMRWEDGFDPEKGEQMPSPGDSVSSLLSEQDSGEQEDPLTSIHHSASATTESESTHVQELSANHSIEFIDNNIHTTATTISIPGLSTLMEHSKELSQHQTFDPQELRRGIVEDITGVLLSWKKEQDAKAKKTEASLGGLGFMEGVVIGGLIVAFMMRFSR